MLAYLNFEGRPPTDNDRSHMCLLVAVSGLRLRGMSVDILAQIGVVVLVTLASKNAILIIEFAKQAQDTGASIRDAVVDAARTRLRPILMTCPTRKLYPRVTMM